MSNEADVHVTKLAAAERQLRSALRLFFQEEDELAIHTVASAAYQIIKDLKTHRGRSEVGDHYFTLVFYAVRSYHRGDLPEYLASDPEAMTWIRKIAAELPISADSRFEDAITRVPEAMESAYWRERNRIPNFLKHADRDKNSSIATSELENAELLQATISAYLDLVPVNPPPEFLPFISYMTAQHEIDAKAKGDMIEIARDIRAKPESLRKKYTWVFLQEYIRSSED